jgi:hypothetical protein
MMPNVAIIRFGSKATLSLPTIDAPFNDYWGALTFKGLYVTSKDNPVLS